VFTKISVTPNEFTSVPANFKTLFGKGGQGCVGFACVLQHVLAQDDGALEEGFRLF
jgi:hypothetical protein